MSQSYRSSQIPCGLARDSTWVYKMRSIQKQTQTDAKAWLLDKLYTVQIYKDKGRQMDRQGC